MWKLILITGSEMLALDCFCPLSKGYWSRAPLPLQERTPSLVPTASFPWENVYLCHTIHCLPLGALCGVPGQFDGKEGNLQAFWNPRHGYIFKFQLCHMPNRGFKKNQNNNVHCYVEVECWGWKGGAVENIWFCCSKGLTLLGDVHLHQY